MFEFFSNIKDNWPTISTILGVFGAACVWGWRFLTGGLKAVKEAKTAAALSADKAGTSAAHAQTSARQLAGASQTLESLQFQVEQLTIRLETAERAVKQRDEDFLRMKELQDETQERLRETQETLERTAEQLSMVQTREVEKDKLISKLQTELADVRRQLLEAHDTNSSLARRLESQNINRYKRKKVPGEGAIESEEQQ